MSNIPNGGGGGGGGALVEEGAPEEGQFLTVGDNFITLGTEKPGNDSSRRASAVTVGTVTSEKSGVSCHIERPVFSQDRFDEDYR